MDKADALIERTEQRRMRATDALSGPHRARLGQFFTPYRAAELIAAMPRLPDHGTLRVLDPGAGVGSLTAAVVARALREVPSLSIEIVAIEVDPSLAVLLEETLTDCTKVAASAGVSVTTAAVIGDLIAETTGFGCHAGPLASPFDLVIMNPPYRKLGSQSAERVALAAQGVDCPNLYCAFLAMAVLRLKPQGQLVAITPRSFANGPYFGIFRKFFLARMTLDKLHVFESRSAVFADSNVLQENVIFSATHSGNQGDVVLSISRSHTDTVSARNVPYADVVKPGDTHQFVHIPTDESDTRLAESFLNLPCNLSNLGIQVSTGKVVDFRASEYLLNQPTTQSIPLIYPGNLRAGRVQWPLPLRKPQALVNCDETRSLQLPRGRYVLVKRFSAKEERRRVVAAIYNPEEVGTSEVGFENHLNVFHHRGGGIREQLAHGLCLWLNSTAVDKFFRTFSGHTQVNATDLRSMRYPSQQQLAALGSALGLGTWPDQEKIDSIVAMHVFPEEQQP